MKKLNTLNVVTTAMLCSFAVVMSSSMHHLSADVAKMFSPMHLPVFLAGILCGQWLGLVCGACAPLLSFLSSGRPLFPYGLFPMVFELATYGFIIGLMRNIFVNNPKTHKFSTILSLAIAMVAGRIVNAIVAAIVFAMGGELFWPTLVTKLAESFAFTWAGIIIQLIFVPAILLALQKGGVLIKYLPDVELPPETPCQGQSTQADVADVATTEQDK